MRGKFIFPTLKTLDIIIFIFLHHKGENPFVTDRHRLCISATQI